MGRGTDSRRILKIFPCLLLLVVFLWIHLATRQSIAAPPRPPAQSDLVHLDDGRVSKNIYRNDQLGFTWGFPRGWVVNDRKTQQRALNDGYQFAMADDLAVKSVTAPARLCSKGLLLVTKYPEGMYPNESNPLGFLAAVDPQCAPDVRFPNSVNDNQAIQGVAGRLERYVKTPPIDSRKAARIRAFENDGRVVFTISEWLAFSTHELGG